MATIAPGGSGLNIVPPSPTLRQPSDCHGTLARPMPRRPPVLDEIPAVNEPGGRPTHRDRTLSALSAALVAFALVVLPMRAGAQSRDLDDGRAAFARGAWSNSVEAFSRVLHDPSASRAELIDAYRYLAVARLALNDTGTAERYAEHALALDPTVTPPQGSPPASTTLFARVHDRRQAARLQIDVATQGPVIARRSSTVRVEVNGLPQNFEGRWNLRCTSAGTTLASMTADASNGAFEVQSEPVDTHGSMDCVATVATRVGVVLDRRTFHAVATAGEGALSFGGSSGTPPWLLALVGSGAATVVGVVLIESIVAGPTSTVRLGAPSFNAP